MTKTTFWRFKMKITRQAFIAIAALIIIVFGASNAMPAVAQEPHNIKIVCVDTRDGHTLKFTANNSAVVGADKNFGTVHRMMTEHGLVYEITEYELRNFYRCHRIHYNKM